MSAPGGLVVGGTPLTPREAQPLAATVAPVGASCVRCLLRPLSAHLFGGQRRTFRSTAWPGRHSFGDQRRTCRSTVWFDRTPPLRLAVTNILPKEYTAASYYRSFKTLPPAHPK